ncbi:MAG: GSCFA domain-containing protein [Haliea sp.]
MELPYRLRRFARRTRTTSSAPENVTTVDAAARNGALEFALVDLCNSSWKKTCRGSRLSFVRKPVLCRDYKVMTIGSCFALEIRAALRRHGFDVYPKYGDIVFDPKLQTLAKLPKRDDINHYNTFTIRAEFERALFDRHLKPDDFVKYSALWRQMLGDSKGEIWQDPYRKHVYAANEAAILDLSRKIDACMRDAILTSDIYIITLGLTEVWRNDRNGMVVNQTPDRELDGRASGFTFERSNYEQNYENMRSVCSLLAERFPEKKIVLTVSPVALSRTYSGNDIVVANMESKCTLRAVAAAITKEFDNVLYWPSFEIAMARDIYQEDGRHVTHDGVKSIMDQFLAVHLAN